MLHLNVVAGGHLEAWELEHPFTLSEKKVQSCNGAVQCLFEETFSHLKVQLVQSMIGDRHLL